MLRTLDSPPTAITAAKGDAVRHLSNFLLGKTKVAMTGCYAILRTTKIKSFSQLSRVGIHNERGVIPSNVDAARVIQNRYFVDSQEALTKRVQQRIAEGAPGKRRRDAVLAVEILCAVSPGWSGSVAAWTTDTVKFIEEKFGGANVVSAALHLDEKTPHIHFVVVPIVQGKLRAATLIGSPAKLSALQSEYHAAVQQHGLSRGKIGSTSAHVRIAEMHEANGAAARLIDEAISTMPRPKRWGNYDDYTQSLSRHFGEKLKPLECAASARLIFEEERRSRLASEKLAREEREKRKGAETETERLRKDEIERLRKLDLVEVAVRLTGIVPRREGASMVIEDERMKIVITGEKFKDFKSSGRGDGGAISLTCHILKCDFKEAVRWLATDFGTGVEGELRRHLEVSVKRFVTNAMSEPVSLSERMERFAKRDDARWPQARAFLVDKRALPADLVDDLFERGDIWANPWGSACFAKRDDGGKIAGAVIRGSATDFKQSLGSKRDAWFQVGDGKIVAVTESPIDALSLHSMSGIRALASEGESDMEALCGCLRQEGVERIFAAQDADETGEKQARALLRAANKFGFDSERLDCAAHDWNELLQRLRSSFATAVSWTVKVVRSVSERLGFLRGLEEDEGQRL